MIGWFSSACKIDKNTYFFHGGKKNSILRDEAYLINIKDKSYEELNSGPKRLECGSALKDNKVYIFGGLTGDSCAVTECGIFI